MKVTPDRESPINPKATTYQGEDRLPKKYAAFPALRPVYQAIPRRNTKYPPTHVRMIAGDIAIPEKNQNTLRQTCARISAPNSPR
jgi:hypothetical protein